MKKLEVDLACAVPDFLWRAFKLSITCLTGLCLGRQAQTGRRGTFAKNCCIDATFLAAQLTMLILSITCMNYSYHRCTLYMDKCDQMRTYDYISVFTAYMLWFCDCSLLAAVACVRNIWSPLQRSLAWALCSRCRVGGVCLRQCGIWSCFDLEHEAMDWFLAWLVSSQETRELYRDLEERSKTQACRFWACSVQRLEVDLACAVPDFLWRAFKLSITSLTGLCFGRQAQTGRRGTFAKNCCIDATFLAAQLTMLILSITCMNYSYHRCTLYMDKCDQMRTYDYISVFTAYMLWFCDCSLLAAVACVRNIWSPLQRSLAWALCSRCRVGGVCLRQCGIWSCFDLEHEAMDWFLAWLVSSQETRELYRDLEERSKTQACRFWACSCPKQISRWLVGKVHCCWIDLA